MYKAGDLLAVYGYVGRILPGILFLREGEVYL